MSDLIEEIKEDVRIDQIIKFFKNYANYIIASILIFAVSSAGYGLWHHFREKKRYFLASRFDQALEASSTGHSHEATALLTELEKSASGGYKTLAAFRQALLKSGSSEDKAEIYRKIMEDSAIEPKFRELAAILWGYEIIDSGEAAHLQQKLEPIAKSRSPWKDSAQELLALLEIRLGETGAAIQRLKNLSSDESAVIGIRTRAFALLEQLGN